MPANTPVIHTFDPVFNTDSKILILGTIPSPKSRAEGFYYSHPRNKFWPVLSEILSARLPNTTEEKTKLLLENKIAVWDVLRSCDIKNADDATIKNPIANDLSVILKKAPVTAIFTTGKKATDLYMRYCLHKTSDLAPVYLPSTSPANCRYYSYDDLLRAYDILRAYLR